MCQHIHANSYINKVVKEIKKQIKHQPEKVGEFYFKNFLPPKLVHLNDRQSNQKAIIHDGIGKTLIFIVKRYEQGEIQNKSVQKLKDTVYDRDATHKHIASVLIETTKAVIRGFQFDTADNKKKFILVEPKIEELGAKKIFFLPLVMILDLFINMLMCNYKYKIEFEKREKEWLQFVAMHAAPNNSDTIH